MQHRAVKATDLDPYWSGGSAPLLEIIPRLDPFKPQASWSELHDAVGDRATTVVVEDASHALFPEQLNRAVDAILNWTTEL